MSKWSLQQIYNSNYNSELGKKEILVSLAWSLQANCVGCPILGNLTRLAFYLQQLGYKGPIEKQMVVEGVGRRESRILEMTSLKVPYYVCHCREQQSGAWW